MNRKSLVPALIGVVLLISSCNTTEAPESEAQDRSPVWVDLGPGTEIAFLVETDGSERFWTFTSDQEPSPEPPTPGRRVGVEVADSEPDVLVFEFAGYPETSTVSVRFEDGVVMTVPIAWGQPFGVGTARVPIPKGTPFEFPDEPGANSPDAAGSQEPFPVVGLDHPEATFESGFAAMTEFGPEYESQWLLGSGNVDIIGRVIDVGTLDLQVRIRAESADPGVIQGIEIRGFQGYHAFDSTAYLDVYMWFENGGLVTVHLDRLEDRATEVLDALVILNETQVAELTGGWLDISGG